MMAELSAFSTRKVLVVEPFYGGSHRGLVDVLSRELGEKCLLSTMTAKKWCWRSRTSALHMALAIENPLDSSVKTLLASSVLNLAELVALRPDLGKLRKVMYFHENQLIYPRQEQKERDFQYGYNQILSCLVADLIVFNSKFNKTSFLTSIKSFLKMMPDYRPKNLEALIAPKCQVIYYPIEFPIEMQPKDKVSQQVLHILWPHRWEHDKGPEDFFNVLFRLKDNKIPFKLSVIGETFSQIPEVFEKARERLEGQVVNWGFQKSRSEYWKVVSSCHVVVSTARHEFFGVSMLESTFCGCYPLCPNRLVYPEIYPHECLYETNENLYQRLEELARNPASVPAQRLSLDWEAFDSSRVVKMLVDCLQL